MSKQGGPCQNEQEIVEGLQAGDGKAVERFYELFANRLYRYIHYQVGGVKEDAEDLLQETFMASLHSIHNFRGESCLYTWLCSIARHKVQDFFRQSGKHPKVLELDDESDDDNPVGMTVEKFLYRDFQDHESAIALREMTEEALLKLPEMYREVLVLRYIEDLSVTEISGIMERSYKATESLLSRARVAFREAFERTKEDFE